MHQGGTSVSQICNYNCELALCTHFALVWTEKAQGGLPLTLEGAGLVPSCLNEISNSLLPST